VDERRARIASEATHFLGAGRGFAQDLLARLAHDGVWRQAERHLVSDMCGLMLRIEAGPAGMRDRDGAALALDRIAPRLPLIERFAATARAPVKIAMMTRMPRRIARCRTH